MSRPVLTDGWHALPCGGAVKIEDGRPVRLSDGAKRCEHVHGEECEPVISGYYACGHECGTSDGPCRGADTDDIVREAEALCGVWFGLVDWTRANGAEPDRTAIVRLHEEQPTHRITFA